MSSKTLFIAASIMLILLTISNLVTLYAYLGARGKVNDALYSLKKAPETFREEAKEFVKGVQGQAEIAFMDMLRNMKLFRQLSEESERKLRDSLRERALYFNAIQKNPQNKLPQAIKVIEMDNKILNSYVDYAKLQALHRQKLVEKLDPLAEALGFHAEGQPAKQS